MTLPDAVWCLWRLAIRSLAAAMAIVIGLTAWQRVPHANEKNLIQNGSFESGVNIPDNPGYLPLSPGSTAINNWTVIRGGIDYYGTGWVASNGHRSLDLNGTPGVGKSFSQFVQVSL